MSSLNRYKKSGGFVQLLSLIETFGPAKKEKFLEMIDNESRAWGAAIREKMLTLERIFSWPDQVIIEVFKTLPPRNQALAITGLKEEQRARVLAFFSPSDKRRLDTILDETKPTPDEIASNMVKVVELTRKMVSGMELRPDKFDEALIIPEDFEAKLEREGVNALVRKGLPDKKTGGTTETSAHYVEMPEPELPPPSANIEVAQVQRTLNLVVKENRVLKDEIKTLREKLDQIKRIA